MAADVVDPGAQPHAMGRRLEFLPAALLGNGSLLVPLSARGEVERMLWPNVGGPDNLGRSDSAHAPRGASTGSTSPPRRGTRPGTATRPFF